MNTVNSNSLSSIKSGKIQGGSHDGANDLLSSLGQRVSDTLAKGRTEESNKINLDSQLVKNYISGISAQPLPGMSHNFVV